MHRHHLGIDADTITAIWVNGLGDLNKGQRRRVVGVKILTDRVRSFKDIEMFRASHVVLCYRRGIDDAMKMVKGSRLCEIG